MTAARPATEPGRETAGTGASAGASAESGSGARRAAAKRSAAAPAVPKRAASAAAAAAAGKKRRTEGFISRILFPPESGSDHSSSRPTRNAAPCGETRAGSTMRSCWALLRAGFALPAGSPRRTVVSCTAFSPLPRGVRAAVCFLWHFPSARFARALPATTAGRLALWSPDFPPRGKPRGDPSALRPTPGSWPPGLGEGPAAT